MKKKKTPSQNEILINYLRKHKSITSKDAANKLGIYRLSARIYDLKQQHYKFDTTKVEKYNRFLKKTTFVAYSLVE